MAEDNAQQLKRPMSKSKSVFCKKHFYSNFVFYKKHLSLHPILNATRYGQIV